MTVQLSDLFDTGQLADMVDAGMVRQFEHDNGDLVGYNYTHLVQWEREWNPVTLKCRGLIADTKGRVVARPFPKFFNLNEDPDAVIERAGVGFQVFEKLDGSLGILYRWNGIERIATRGSFHSEQAEWATGWWNDNPTGNPLLGATELFEIIYPQNRVVVDYGSRQGLFHLATVDIETGDTIPTFWPLTKRAVSYSVPPGVSPSDLPDLWPNLDDGNFEGFVVQYDDGHRVKVKLSEYVRLHRIMSSTSNRTVWEALRAGTSISQMFEAVAEFDSIRHLIDPDDRKPFAMEAKDSDLAALLFAMFDGKDYSDHIWKRIRPESIEYPPIGGAGEVPA